MTGGYLDTICQYYNYLKAMAAPVITPAGPLAKKGKETQNFSANQSVTWSASGGSFTNVTATTATWHAPNDGGNYTVTGTNGSAEATHVTVTVTGVVPAVPSWGFEVENKKKVLLFEADDGTRETRTKGPRKRTFTFTTRLRPKAEFLELETFWDAHYPGKQVYFTHPGTSVEVLYWIDSPLKEQWTITGFLSYSFVLQQV